jgi:hypothetical protein
MKRGFLERFGDQTAKSLICQTPVAICMVTDIFASEEHSDPARDELRGWICFLNAPEQFHAHFRCETSLHMPIDDQSSRVFHLDSALKVSRSATHQICVE